MDLTETWYPYNNRPAHHAGNISLRWCYTLGLAIQYLQELGGYLNDCSLRRLASDSQSLPQHHCSVREFGWLFEVSRVQHEVLNVLPATWRACRSEMRAGLRGFGHAFPCVHGRRVELHDFELVDAGHILAIR